MQEGVIPRPNDLDEEVNQMTDGEARQRLRELLEENQAGGLPFQFYSSNADTPTG